MRAVRYRALPELCPTCESAEPIRTSEYLGESCYLCPDCNLVWTVADQAQLFSDVMTALGHSKDSKGHIITTAQSAKRTTRRATKKR